MNSETEQTSIDSHSQEWEDYMPPSAPIARKRGRFPKLQVAASLPSPSLDNNRVDFAKALNLRQQGGPLPNVPPTVPPTVQLRTQPTVLPAVINRQV